ncbi:MAG: helix-turn-helix domain-containing protein [bacterium]
MEIHTVKEAAEFLGITRKAMYSLIFRRKIPFRKPLPRKVMIIKEDLIKWLERAPGLKLEDLNKY